ncbi:MAG: hypothetical protein HKM06_07610 [Spirochaetales bacterium]|nr:hypothetical protein [Spirochaetales bacterium]
MKSLGLIFCLLSFLFFTDPAVAAQGTSVDSATLPDAPALTEAERALPLVNVPVSWDSSGRAYWKIQGRAIGLAELSALTPWQTMELVQLLSGEQIPFSRFGDMNGLRLRAWKSKLAAYLAASSKPSLVSKAQLFNPQFSVWDPGWIQHRNTLGQWYIHLFRRNIIESDLRTLSPLEVAQAIRVLTGRRYPMTFILEHLETFRTELRIEKRVEGVSQKNMLPQK